MHCSRDQYKDGECEHIGTSGCKRRGDGCKATYLYRIADRFRIGVNLMLFEYSYELQSHDLEVIYLLLLQLRVSETVRLRGASHESLATAT